MFLPYQAPPLRTDSQEVLRFLQLISSEECVAEIRILDAVTADYQKPHTLAGYFEHDHLHQAASEIARIQDGRKSSARGVYVTLNPVIPALLARACNRLKI